MVGAQAVEAAVQGVVDEATDSLPTPLCATASRQSLSFAERRGDLKFFDDLNFLATRVRNLEQPFRN